QVQARGSSCGERAVRVGGVAAGVGGAVGEVGVTDVIAFGCLADEVAAAAGRAGTGIGRAWPLAHFDLLDVDDITGLRADIAQAINEGIALGIEAPDDRPVAGWVAALARAEGDA